MRRRLVLPRSATGRLARQVDEAMGDGVAEVLIGASGGYPHVMPVAGMPGFLHDGEFYPLIAGGGWTTVDDVLAECRDNGKLQRHSIDKSDSNNTANVSVDLWLGGGQPIAGTAAVLPGGTVMDRTSTGAVPLQPAASGDRLHYLGARAVATNPCTYILVDMLWRGQIAGNSAAAQTISGVPTRYQGTDAAGTVCGLSITSGPAATAHNHTFKYVDDSGNAVETSPSSLGIAGGANHRIDCGNSGQWFLATNASDMGIRNLTEYTMSAAVATGGWQIWLAHPLAFIPAYVGPMLAGGDTIATVFNLVEVKDQAALTLFKVNGPNNGNINSAEILVGSG